MAAITIKDIQNSLRLDSELDVTEQALIQRYIDTAESYVQSAVDSNVSLETFRKINQFNTAVALFAEFLYQSRGQAGKVAEQRPFEITAMIGQLKGMNLPEENQDNN